MQRSGGPTSNYLGGNYPTTKGSYNNNSIPMRDVRREREQERKLSPTFKIALIFSMVAMVCLVISFASPNWLVHDKRFTQYQMRNLGLWEVCFKGFRHPHQTYDKVYNGCWWVFSRYYDELLDYIEKGFFIAVQVFMSLGFLLFFIAMAMLIPVFLRVFDIDTEISVTLVLAGIMLLSSLSNLIGLIVFAVHGDDRDWMIDAQWFVYSWAFYLGWVGVVSQTVAGLFYLCEGRSKNRKRTKELTLKMHYAMSTNSSSSSSSMKKSKSGNGAGNNINNNNHNTRNQNQNVMNPKLRNGKMESDTSNAYPYYNYGNDIDKSENDFVAIAAPIKTITEKTQGPAWNGGNNVDISSQKDYQKVSTKGTMDRNARLNAIFGNRNTGPANQNHGFSSSTTEDSSPSDNRFLQYQKPYV